VPTLFDALEQGKPAPARATAAGFARLQNGAALTFTPDDSMHPFAFGATVRSSRDGAVATITGATLDAAMAMKKEERAGGRGTLEFETTTLTPSTPFSVTLGVENGLWIYTASNGTHVASSVKADAAAHQLVVSHYTARGETLFFVDGKLAGRVSERLEPRRFMLGGAAADYRDLLIYRSALNADEAAALANGSVLQASLEVYSPLTDLDLHSGGPVKNLAQSLTSANISAGSVKHTGR
jgi:hypothetical protein